MWPLTRVLECMSNGAVAWLPAAQVRSELVDDDISLKVSAEDKRAFCAWIGERARGGDPGDLTGESANVLASIGAVGRMSATTIKADEVAVENEDEARDKQGNERTREEVGGDYLLCARL